jgi:hypothetical protein
MSAIATIGYSTCSALLEVSRQERPGEPNVVWRTSDEALCKALPVRRCPACSSGNEDPLPLV